MYHWKYKRRNLVDGESRLSEFVDELVFVSEHARETIALQHGHFALCLYTLDLRSEH